MTLVAGMRQPVPAWGDVRVRDAWLIVHIVLVLAGYAALLLTAVSSVFYLIQERRLKTKKSQTLLEKLPPLGTLDDLISSSMGFGFVLHYAGRGVRRHVGLHRARHQVGGQRQHLAVLPDLGIVPGDDLHARVGGLARTKSRGHGAGGAGMRRANLGGARRVEAHADSMKLLITGLSHHTAPVEVREKLAFEEKTLPEALDRLCQRPGMVEGMILSTCNRVEVAVTAEEQSDPEESVDRFSGGSAQRGAGLGVAVPVSLRRPGCDPPRVPRGFEFGLDDRGRAADSGATEERLRAGQRARFGQRLSGPGDDHGLSM